MHSVFARLAGLMFCCATSAHAASPADYVYTPGVEYGEREIDFKLGYAHPKPGDNLNAAGSIGFGYGAKPWWFTEFYLKYERTTGEGGHFDAFEWENRFQLTEPGEHAVDVGFVTEIERPKNHDEGWELRLGPLFQTEFGRVQANLNVLLQRSFDAATPGETDLGYQMQIKYRWRPGFEPGLQAFGELGKWNDWNSQSQQNHRIGPAFFGKLHLGGRRNLVYNAALLYGLTDTAPAHTLRMQVEYEF